MTGFTGIRKILALAMAAVLIATAGIGCAEQTSAPEEEVFLEEELPVYQALVLSHGEIEDWALGCSAIIATRNYFSSYQFCMLERSELNTAVTKQILAQDWGCTGRSDLLDILDIMIDHGHSVEFAEDYSQVSSMSDEEFEAYIERLGGIDRYMWPLTRTLGEKWDTKLIRAWDWFRVIHIIEWAYVAEFIEIEEVYELMTPVIERLYASFSSWEEATENYLDGYAWWSRTDVSLSDSEYKRRLLVYEELKDSRVLYEASLWLPRSAETATGYTPDYKYLDNGDGTCTLLRHRGLSSGDLIIPAELNGLAVSIIGTCAFFDRSGFTEVVFPASVTMIETDSFANCSGLAQAVFLGDAPLLDDQEVFLGCAQDFTILYEEQSSGWSTPEWNGYPAFPRTD